VETFNTVVNSVLLNLGGSLLITIVLFILGLCFGAGFKKSFRGGLYAGIGLTCLNMMTGFLTTALGPTVQGLAEIIGRTTPVNDIGWGVAGLAFSWPGAAFTIIAVMVVNVILIMTRAAKTMWTDIWSFWHGQVVGCFVWAMTGNLTLGVLAATLFLTVGTFLGDLTAKEYQEFNNMPGISISCCYALFGLISKPFNWLFDRIPGLKDVDVSPDTIREKFGVFGDQGVMGAIIGFIIGVVVWLFGKGSLFAALNLAVNVGVFMVFLPKTIGVLCEGVIPIANAVVNLVHEKFSGRREIWVAIDCGALMGSPAVLASAVILYPLVVVISMFLPGNSLLPIASLAVIPAQCGAVAPFFKGNILRMVIFVLLLNIPLLYLASVMAPVQTAAMASMGMGDPAVLNSSLDMGGDPLGFVVVNAFKLFTGK
jgi:PTS system galactitol-specific IIC component